MLGRLRGGGGRRAKPPLASYWHTTKKTSRKGRSLKKVSKKKEATLGAQRVHTIR